MTKNELELIKELVDQVASISNKLDILISSSDAKQTKTPQVSDNQKLVNGLIHICTHDGYDDKQYCNALKQLREFNFTLSPKQTAWILAYTYRHPEAGDSIVTFIQTEFKKCGDKNKYIDSISFELRKNYASEKNCQFIEGIIRRIKEL